MDQRNLKSMGSYSLAGSEWSLVEFLVNRVS